MSLRFFQDVANKKTNGKIVHTDDQARADFFAKQARWKELVGDDVPASARKTTQAKTAKAEPAAKAKESEGEEPKKAPTRRTAKTAD